MENTSEKSWYKASEIQLVYKSKVLTSQRPSIKSSADACRILREAWEDENIDFLEQFKVLLLNRANKVLGIVEISKGGTAGTVVDPKIVFAAAIKTNCSAIILAHNHPSGNLRPSDQDIRLTRKLKECGNLLEINVWDHLIITREGYLSFADEGLL